jgi:uridine kinase
MEEAVQDPLDSMLMRITEMDDVEQARCRDYAVEDMLHKALFPSRDAAVLDRRFAAWNGLREEDPDLKRLAPLTVGQVWRVPLTVAQYLAEKPYRIVGVAGPSGVGKTTMARTIKECLRFVAPTARVVSVSLDDFVLSKAERIRRDIRFRAEPGSHDREAIRSTLTAVQKGVETVVVSRFDHGRDDVLPPETISGPISMLLFEGWFVGARIEGYEIIADALDYLIYLDCSLELSRTRRMLREESLRDESNGQEGFSVEDMEAFWTEVLEPGIERYVIPVKADADLVLQVSASAVVGVRTRN